MGGNLAINGGLLNLNGYVASVGTLNLAGGSISGGTQSLLLGTAFNVQSGTIGVTLAGFAPLTKTTTGTVILNAANAYAGLTSVQAGTLQLGASAALVGDVQVSGGTLNTNGQSGNIGNLSLAGGAIVGSGTLSAISYSFSSGQSTIDLGDIQGSALVKSTTGLVVLGGSNSYTGGTTVSGGTLQVGGNSALAGGVLAVTASGTVDLAGFSPTVTGLNGSAGTITSSVGSGDLVVRPSGSTTFAGTLQNGANGTLALSMTGTGTLTLTGTNSYTGGTTISAGVLSIATTAALPNWSTHGSYSVASGAILAVGDGVADANVGSIVSANNFAVGDTLGFDTTAGNRTYAGNLTNTASGALDSPNSGPTSSRSPARIPSPAPTMINAGVLSLANSAALAGSGTITFGGGTLQFSATNTKDYSAYIANSTGAITIDTNGQSVTFAGVLASSNSGGLTKIGSGTLTVPAPTPLPATSRSAAGPCRTPTATATQRQRLGDRVGQCDGRGPTVTINNGGTLFVRQRQRPGRRQRHARTGPGDQRRRPGDLGQHLAATTSWEM